MKVDYEELMQYYEAAQNKTPGEWKDAIEAILDAVPRIVKEHETLEAELATYKQPIDFPKLRESVSHIDNSLGEYLEDSIKRAAARP